MNFSLKKYFMDLSGKYNPKLQFLIENVGVILYTSIYSNSNQIYIRYWGGGGGGWIKKFFLKNQ
jgi:hypothetical protein